jgi:mRNA-degrading endonuclease toxin of MazEF toxin-antitoxin module
MGHRREVSSGWDGTVHHRHQTAETVRRDREHRHQTVSRRPPPRKRRHQTVRRVRRRQQTDRRRPPTRRHRQQTVIRNRRSRTRRSRGTRNRGGGRGCRSCSRRSRTSVPANTRPNPDRTPSTNGPRTDASPEQTWPLSTAILPCGKAVEGAARVRRDLQRGAEAAAEAGRRPLQWAGKGEVVQTDRANRHRPHTLVVPFTTRIHRTLLPSHVLVAAGEGGLVQDPVALCEQIRVIDNGRLLSRLGDLPAARMPEVDNALRAVPEWSGQLPPTRRPQREAAP